MDRPPKPPRAAYQPRRRAQRGAALLTAMIIVTLVVTLAASMVWQQWRAVQVEAAERSRTQSAWILAGALDWSGLLLREDFKTGRPTAFGEPWSLPLQEARLSTFLAADSNNTDDGPEAFLSGAITDAQGRYNLMNLTLGDTEAAKKELLVLQSLCALIGLSEEVATTIANGLRGASATTEITPATPLLPRRLSQLSWIGVSPDAIGALEPYVVLLPATTPATATLVNANTAPREVLAAVLNVDVANAERLVQGRKAGAFKTMQDVSDRLSGTSLSGTLVFRSDYFEVWGKLRLSDRVLEVRSLVHRSMSDGKVTVLQSQRVASREQ